MKVPLTPLLRQNKPIATVTLELTGLRRFRLRLWLAKMLIRFAGWLAYSDVKEA
jgi:hypothetical protein